MITFRFKLYFLKKKVSVAVVDDHQLFRKGIIALLKDFPEIEVVFEAGNGNELITALKTFQPDVILLDVSMPELAGIELLAKVKNKYPDMKVVMLSQHFDNQTIYNFMKNGANGFLPKDAEIETIIEAFHAVTEKGNYFSDRVSEALARGAVRSVKVNPSFAAVSLTSREIEVLRLICKEKSIQEIGDILHLSPRTIDTYIEKLYHKTGARKREGLVVFAMQHDLF